MNFPINFNYTQIILSEFTGHCIFGYYQNNINLRYDTGLELGIELLGAVA